MDTDQPETAAPEHDNKSGGDYYRDAWNRDSHIMQQPIGAPRQTNTRWNEWVDKAKKELEEKRGKGKYTHTRMFASHNIRVEEGEREPRVKNQKTNPRGEDRNKAGRILL